MAEVIGPCNAAHHLPGRGGTSTRTAPPLATAIGRPSQPASFPVWQLGASMPALGGGRDDRCHQARCHCDVCGRDPLRDSGRLLRKDAAMV